MTYYNVEWHVKLNLLIYYCRSGLCDNYCLGKYSVINQYTC